MTKRERRDQETRDQRPDNIVGANLRMPNVIHARYSKANSNYVIWFLVSGLSHKPVRYGNRLSIMLSGFWSLVSFYHLLDMETGFRLCYPVTSPWSLVTLSNVTFSYPILKNLNIITN